MPLIPHCALFTALTLPLVACMDNGIAACHDKLELGILSPAPNALFAQGFSIPVQANVRSTCGADLAKEGFFVLTSTEEGELGGDWRIEEGDGWGVPQGEILACEAPEGSIAFTVEEDCNDADGEIYPGHADYCGDGIDSDCDSITPTGCFPWGEVSAAYATRPYQEAVSNSVVQETSTMTAKSTF